MKLGGGRGHGESVQGKREGWVEKTWKEERGFKILEGKIEESSESKEKKETVLGGGRERGEDNFGLKNRVKRRKASK